ncbi:MAG TPA: hypothetical protein VMT51_14045, partial [Dongiaceae bacterium]|nr:hypothetical protein [Dongiaceae bacterium]
DVVTLNLDMAPQILEANARVVEDNGRGAVQRGPIVYCLEGLDQKQGVSVADVALTPSGNSAKNAGFTETYDKDLLDGVVVLQHEGSEIKTSAARSGLYFPASAAANTASKVPLTFIPYYAWANRTPTPMLVWTRLSKS